MDQLPLFHCLSGRPVIVVGDGPAAEAKRRLIERAGGIPVSEKEGGARLAFIAVDDPGSAARAAARLRASGLLVNVADKPELCDFTLPAIVDRAPVLLAVGTGGASAGLAKWLRMRLEALLPHELGRLAAVLASAKQRMRKRWPDAAERRRALDVALAPGGLLDPLRPDAAEQVDSWLTGAGDAEASATVQIVLRSDDPEDLTLREARLLGCADLVLHERDVPAAVLDRARADAIRRSTEAVGEGTSGLTVVLRR